MRDNYFPRLQRQNLILLQKCWLKNKEDWQVKMYVWAWDEDESQQGWSEPPSNSPKENASSQCTMFPSSRMPRMKGVRQSGAGVGKLSSRSPWLLWITEPSRSSPWHPYPCTFSVSLPPPWPRLFRFTSITSKASDMSPSMTGTRSCRLWSQSVFLAGRF